MKFVWCLVCGSALVLLSCLFGGSFAARGSHPHGLGERERERYQHQQPHQQQQIPDQVPAATGHHHHTGRVQIKVYRGQSKGHGWEHFAPYGYWVRQPADDHHHGWSR